MSRLELQASSDLPTITWPRMNGAMGHRRVRSLQRRIVPAVQAGAWRKGKRLRSLLVPSFAARAFAVKRGTENTGQNPPGVEGDLWDTPEKKAQAVERIERWQRYRPMPLQRLYLPKKSGNRRPVALPALVDRARQALYLHAVQPIAEPLADPHSYGFRPKRRCAEALAQCVPILRQKPSATWGLAGDSQGVFDTLACSWLAAHRPRNKCVLSNWLRSGFMAHGALSPPTAGVPPGGIRSPVVSPLVWEGLEAVVHGGPWHRRVPHINDVRWADDFIVTANSRQVLEETVLPRITACLAARGLRLSTEKTVMTPITDGLDFLGQTLRKHARVNGKPAQLQRTPRKASVQSIKTQVQALCKQAIGATPARLIARLHPVLRGGANYHRHVSGAETVAKRDSFGWRRLYRWAKHRPAEKTGRWMTKRYFPHQAGASWRFTDPTSGTQSIRVQEAVTPQRPLKIQGDANPFDPQGEAYCQYHDRQQALRTTAACRAKGLNQQEGQCPTCRQGIQSGETLELPHRDGNHQKNRRANLVLLHPNGHRQVHYAPESTTATSRPVRGVGHA